MPHVETMKHTPETAKDAIELLHLGRIDDGDTVVVTNVYQGQLIEGLAIALGLAIDIEVQPPPKPA